MGDLSAHFSRSELECPDCGLYIPNEELLKVLEMIREYYGLPVEVTSGTRCMKHNKKVGGEPASKHLTGEAADIKVQGVKPETVYNHLNIVHDGGLGIYDWGVHVDICKKPPRRRWDRRGKK